MRPSRAVAVAAASIGLGALVAAAGRRAGRLMSWRSRRMWRLTARNATRFAGTKARQLVTPAERRAALDEQFAIRTAEDVAKELGEMKGVLMKVGQLVSFIAEGLPDEAQAALAALQANAAPMAPSLAAEVVRSELGDDPARVFLRWDDLPVAAASIGQVHRAETTDHREVAVKVQFPGVREAIEEDLDGAEVMYNVFSAMMLNGLDARGLVDELRARMREELDYRLEARNITEFAAHFAGHPWVRTPEVVPELSHERVLTTEWIDGMSWDQFVASASTETKHRAGEVIWRFGQHSIQRLGAFNGDPHPGNYRFHHDGSVTFLDFGLVKRWAPGEWQRLEPSLDAIVVHRDPERLVGAMEESGFLAAGHGLDPVKVYDYVSSPYRPYLVDEFTFTREWMRETLGRIFDIGGPHAEVIAKLNMPPSFVILDRVVWGVSAILGKLNVSGPWRAMLLEYRIDGPPATELGAAEAAWRVQRAMMTRRAVNGIELDVLEAGVATAPAVVLCHGFPECAHSWRHQIEPLAAAGYHVLVPDQRGYGRSSAPRDVGAYGTDQLSADLLGLLDATGHDDAVFVGHDWGALLVWDLARLHPERVRAVVNVSVPYTEWPAPPTDVLRAVSGDNFFYILYFQTVGPAERELEADVETTMRTVLWAASGDGFPDVPPDPLPAVGTGFLDSMTRRGPAPTELPAWLSAGDLATYVASFEASGFFGPISWYRNLDANHAAVQHLPPPAMPAWFIGGTRDMVIAARPGYVEAMEARLPDHRGTTLIDGAGHWTQQEAPEAFNQALLAALAELDGPGGAPSR